MNEKIVEHYLDTLLSLAYFILNVYNMPTGMQYHVEGIKHGKKIHVILEVSENDN